MRISSRELRGQSYPFEQFRHAVRDMDFGTKTMQADRLFDRGSHADARIERRSGILRDDLEPPPHPPQAQRREGAKVDAVE